MLNLWLPSICWPGAAMENATTDCAAFADTAVFLSYFKDLKDPRQQGKITYPLDEILLLCLLAVLAGAETFIDIALFGCKKRELLRRFRPFKDGTPAHDHRQPYTGPRWNAYPPRENVPRLADHPGLVSASRSVPPCAGLPHAGCGDQGGPKRNTPKETVWLAASQCRTDAPTTTDRESHRQSRSSPGRKRSRDIPPLPCGPRHIGSFAGRQHQAATAALTLQQTAALLEAIREQTPRCNPVAPL